LDGPFLYVLACHRIEDEGDLKCGRNWEGGKAEEKERIGEGERERKREREREREGEGEGEDGFVRLLRGHHNERDLNMLTVTGKGAGRGEKKGTREEDFAVQEAGRNKSLLAVRKSTLSGNNFGGSPTWQGVAVDKLIMVCPEN
jgi:hypothetical protein